MFGSDPSKKNADFPPIVEVSLDQSLDIEKNWKIGEAVASLRYVSSLFLFRIKHSMRTVLLSSFFATKPCIGRKGI